MTLKFLRWMCTSASVYSWRCARRRARRAAIGPEHPVPTILPVSTHTGSCQWYGSCKGTGEARLTEHQDAAARFSVCQLDGAEALGGEVGVAAARGDAVEVEWQGDARPLHRYGLRQLRTAGQRH